MKPTAFGPQFVFDAHLHFFSYSFAERLGRQAGIEEGPAERACERLHWEVPPREPVELARRWLAELDEHQVDHTVLFHTLPGDARSVAAAIETAPDRFVGFYMVQPEDAASVEELRTAVDEWGFRGALLFPSLLGFDLRGPATAAVLELAHQRRLIVFVHCGFLKVPFRTALGLPTAYDPLQANPLLLAPLASRFSRARFVVPHLGSGFLRELLLLADQCPNVYADTSGLGSWARHLPSPARPSEALVRAVEVLGPGRLLFGSDSSFFPRGWREDVFHQQLLAFEEAGLVEEQVAMVLGGNLRRLLDEA